MREPESAAAATPRSPSWCCADKSWEWPGSWDGDGSGWHPQVFHTRLVVATADLHAQLEWVENLSPLDDPEHFDDGTHLVIYDREGSHIALPVHLATQAGLLVLAAAIRATLAGSVAC